MTNQRALPGDLARAAEEGRVVDLDVRPDLRAGREPFGRIVGAVDALPADGVLRLRAPFEPVPLYRVLGRRGFDHWTEREAADDWRVWFYRGSGEAAAAAASPAGPAATCPACEARAAGADVTVLDVRGLEPPEPMVRTLEALARLPEGACLVQINDRVPRFLLPKLAERGFAFEVADQTPGQVRVVIRRAPGAPPREAPQAPRAAPELDVRTIPPREKHPTIFGVFDALAPGEAFVLVSDHDPRPLRYELEATRPGTFAWEPLAAGPLEWRVRIARVGAAKRASTGPTPAR